MCEAQEGQQEKKEKKKHSKNNGYWEQKRRQEGMWSGDYTEMISDSVDLHTWIVISRAYSHIGWAGKWGEKKTKKEKKKKTNAFNAP